MSKHLLPWWVRVWLRLFPGETPARPRTRADSDN